MLIGVCQMDIGANWKRSNGQSWNNLNNKISKLVLDYNPKNEMKCPWIKTDINKYTGKRQTPWEEEFQINYVDTVPSMRGNWTSTP